MAEEGGGNFPRLAIIAAQHVAVQLADGDALGFTVAQFMELEKFKKPIGRHDVIIQEADRVGRLQFKDGGSAADLTLADNHRGQPEATSSKSTHEAKRASVMKVYYGAGVQKDVHSSPAGA